MPVTPPREGSGAYSLCFFHRNRALVLRSVEEADVRVLAHWGRETSREGRAVRAPANLGSAWAARDTRGHHRPWWPGRDRGPAQLLGLARHEGPTLPHAHALDSW